MSTHIIRIWLKDHAACEHTQLYPSTWLFIYYVICKKYLKFATMTGLEITSRQRTTYVVSLCPCQNKLKNATVATMWAIMSKIQSQTKMAYGEEASKPDSILELSNWPTNIYLLLIKCHIFSFSTITTKFKEKMISSFQYISHQAITISLCYQW